MNTRREKSEVDPQRSAAGDHGRAPAHSEVRIREEVGALSRALAGLLDTLPGEIQGPTDLGRYLGLDTPLASRLLRLARASTVVEAVELMPTINQLRSAVVRAGESVPGPAAVDANAAIDRFQALVDELGGDQSWFESLASMHLAGGVRRVDLAHRRAAFKANSHLWGRTVESFSTVAILYLAEDGDSLDAVYNFAYIKARVLHPGRSFESTTHTPLANNPESMKRLRAPVLLPEFSDIQEADVSKSFDAEGRAHTHVRLRGERPTTPQTIVTRQILPRFAALSEPDSCFYRLTLTWPAERLHFDLAVESGLSDPSTVVLEARANPKETRKWSDDPADRVPLHESPQVFLNVNAVPAVPGVQRVPQIFETSLEWAGLRGKRFDVYRCNLEYPMMHSQVGIWVRLRRRT